MDVDPDPNTPGTAPWLGVPDGYVSPLAVFPIAPIVWGTSNVDPKQEAPTVTPLPNSHEIPRTKLTPELYERRMQRIHQGLREKAEEDAKRPLVVRKIIDQSRNWKQYSR